MYTLRLKHNITGNTILEELSRACYALHKKKKTLFAFLEPFTVVPEPHQNRH
jgi:hypothetical protein